MITRKLLAALTLAATLLLLPQVADAQRGRRNRGLDITLGLGGAGCTDLECAGFDMSAHTRAQVLFRVIRYFAVGAHVGFQFYDPNRMRDADLGWSMLLGAEVRGILPVGRLEAWLGMAFGYMRWQVEQENDDNAWVDQEWRNAFGLGFGFGVNYFVHRRVALGLDFWIYKGFANELCDYENDGRDETRCWEPNDDEHAAIGATFTFGANVTFYIPL